MKPVDAWLTFNFQFFAQKTAQMDPDFLSGANPSVLWVKASALHSNWPASGLCSTAEGFAHQSHTIPTAFNIMLPFGFSATYTFSAGPSDAVDINFGGDRVRDAAGDGDVVMNQQHQWGPDGVIAGRSTTVNYTYGLVYAPPGEPCQTESWTTSHDLTS